MFHWLLFITYLLIINNLYKIRVSRKNVFNRQLSFYVTMIPKNKISHWSF